ncbi:MAG: DUF5677 domain-containing protein [Candidatus Scalindua sp.]|nr:DUF5677 domain-containing protein [Candidatus Scalindua sp.]
MARKNGKRKKRQSKKGNFTSIAKHKRSGNVLGTVASDLNMKIIEWERDLMPEHLWLDLLADEYKKLQWHDIYNEFLDKIDSVLDEERKTPFLGLISDFGILTENEKNKFLELHKDFAYKFFFLPIGKCLSFYPENPASWLVLDEWKDKESIDFVTELNKLSRSLLRLKKAKDLYAGNLRAVPLNRLFKHNKLFLKAGVCDDLASLLSKYPVNCSEYEQYRVQQFARNSINQLFMITDRYKSRSWPKYFWRHNLNLVVCRPIEGSLRKGDINKDEEIKELQGRFWENCIILMKYVDKIGMQYRYDLYNPIPNEIKLGLFSRIVRLYISFISNPFLWTRDLAGIMLRCIGETTIIFFYLVNKGSEEEIKAFENYSLGKEKILMLHMQDTLQEKRTLEGESIEDISNELGGDFVAEMQKIDLKGWTKKNIRDLSLEVGLENIYRWVVDPTSAEIHGSWSSIKKSNLVLCAQILHRFHRVPKFYEPPIFLVPIYVATRIYWEHSRFFVKYNKRS